MRPKSFRVGSLCFSLFVFPWLICGFVRSSGPSRFSAKSRTPCPLYNSNNDNEPQPSHLPLEREKNDTERKQEAFDWDLFLDTPFFDPDQVANDPNSPPLLRRFAAWVQQDYATAELMATGALFVLLIIASQEMLRIQMFGLENYVPFTKGVVPGNLF
jgi:hypothetical protein